MDVIMLDNSDNARAARAVETVRSRRPETLVEPSGGIRPERRPCRKRSAPMSSRWARTHSAPSVDIGLDHIG